ncbi:MAG: xanthine dehydrogenase family protein [Chromatiales bacterium]|jgi:aerobic carbon-monoxide dehydrogenase large subunit|nr:xanthine dehydrogenase family protein [Chromatiales bacterium]
MAEGFGESVARLEDERFLTGAGRFTADLNRPHQLYAAVVRSEHAHGDLVNIEVGESLGMPGVIAVHTEAMLRRDNVGTLPCTATFTAVSPLVTPPRFALARDRVRFVGEPIALVIGESAEACADAAAQVAVEVTPLPAVVDGEQARQTGAPRLWGEAPGNLAFHFQTGDSTATRMAMHRATHIVELTVINNRVTALPLEPRAGIAEFDPQSQAWCLTCTGQGVYGIRAQLAEVLGVPASRVRVVAPDVGGGFGLKNFLYPEWVLLAWAAKHHQRPIKWIADKSEDLAGAAHGRDSRAVGRLGLDEDGRFIALEADLLANMGAYLSGSGPIVSTRAFPTALGGIYNIRNASMDARGVFTNTVPVDAYRGAGKPEANYLIERLVDEAARRHGFDPIALRLKNAIAQFPYRSATGSSIDSGRFGDNLQDALRFSNPEGFEERRIDAARRMKLLGFGVGCFLETARGVPQENAGVRFLDDGTVELRLGTESNGQGHATAFAQIAARQFGIPIELFQFAQADTTLLPAGFGHGGARSMHMGGGALVKAITASIEAGKQVAADLLQINPNTVQYKSGSYLSDTGASVTLAAVVASARHSTPGQSHLMNQNASVEDAAFTFPNGCHLAEVEIDPDTGTVILARYIIVDDYGNMVNPMLTEGQVHGGTAQGIGQASMEAVVYDTGSGQLLSGSLMDYTTPRATDMPFLDVHLGGPPTTANPLGVKGSGQAGAIGAPQAIVNAVHHALAPFGIDRIDMPLTSLRVWQALRGARLPAS